MIYFDKNLEAYNFEISDCICSISDELWYKHNQDPNTWTIENGQFIEIPLQEVDEEVIDKDEIIANNENLFNNLYIYFPEFIGKSGKVLCKAGYYKRKPKGFSSALESFNELLGFIKKYNGLKGDLIKAVIFYEQPDFLNYNELNFEKFNPKEMDLNDAIAWIDQMKLVWITQNYIGK